MEPVAVPAPAQVAPKGVDTLVLAAAVVLGTLVLVCGDQRTILRGTTDMGARLTAQGPAQKEPPGTTNLGAFLTTQGPRSTGASAREPP